jgi:hypothetical protein
MVTRGIWGLQNTQLKGLFPFLYRASLPSKGRQTPPYTLREHRGYYLRQRLA